MSFVARSLLVTALLLPAAPAAPQQPGSRPLFRSQSDMVVLHVTVFDGNSDAVPALTRDNFLVFEDGRNQEIAFFSAEDVPVAVGLAIDNSSSMIAKQQLVVAGAMAFAESSHPEDELFTVNFNEQVRLGLPPHIPFTSNRTLVRSTLGGLSAGGKTALHDAVIAALDHVERATHQKHVIIVLSDGEDNASRQSRDEMYARAMDSDAIIYTVATNEPRFGGEGNPGVLRRLASLGGGLAYFPRSGGAVVDAFTEIAHNIRRGYSIGYTPTNTAHDGGYRRVKVLVRAGGRALTALCRDGYTAPGQTGSR